MFPSSILAELLPGSIHEKDNIFSAKIEGYLNDLISHLLSFKSQNRLIRQSVVAIATESNLNSLSTVSTRDVCRTIRNFSGLSIPDVTSITRVPHATEAAQAVPAEGTVGVSANLMLDGMTPVDELKARLDLPDLPAEGSYHTLAGLMLAMLRRVPHRGDRIVFGGWLFEVLEMEGRRVDRVRASRETLAQE